MTLMRRLTTAASGALGTAVWALQPAASTSASRAAETGMRNTGKSSSKRILQRAFRAGWALDCRRAIEWTRGAGKGNRAVRDSAAVVIERDLRDLPLVAL